MHNTKPVGTILPLLCASDLTAKQNHLVTWNSSSGLALADAVNESLIGVIDNGGESGYNGDIVPWIPNFPVRVWVSAAVANAAFLQIDTANPGQLVTQTTGPAVAQAMEASSGAGIISVRPLARDLRALGQPAPVTLNTTGTMADGDILAGIITSTTAAAVTGTTRTGTQLAAELAHVGIGQFHDFTIINKGGTNTFTLAGGTGVTIEGSAAVLANISGRFRAKQTAANTWVIYRIG